MRIIALVGAGLLAAGSFGAAPVEAQRYGHHGHHGGYGYGGHDGRHGHGWRGGYGYRGGYGWRGGHRWNRGPRWRGGYGRVVCRGGYYGRRCFRR